MKRGAPLHVVATAVLGGMLLAPVGVVADEKGVGAMTGELTQWQSMKGLAGLEVAFRFLEQTKLADLPLGRTEIEGSDVFVMLSRGPSKDPAQARLEAHRKYIDVQYVVSGQEQMGILPSPEGLTVTQAYDETKDVEFFETPKTLPTLAVRAGSFAVFLPGQPHKPACHLDGPHEVLKAVVKVSAEWRARQVK
jgi:biofilm protein TabA